MPILALLLQRECPRRQSAQLPHAHAEQRERVDAHHEQHLAAERRRVEVGVEARGPGD